jgi:uncharacterized surface protein with fasciclin (FAS1) repeats
MTVWWFANCAALTAAQKAWGRPARNYLCPAQSANLTSGVGGSSFTTLTHLFIPMKKTILSLALAALFSVGASTTVSAQSAKTKTVMVGGAPMYPTKNIVENAVNSKDHTILTYHVVAGRMTAADLTKAIKAGKGTATLKTVSGGTLTAMAKGKTITLKDEKGGMSTVTIADVLQSNGVIHVIDTVVMP